MTPISTPFVSECVWDGSIQTLRPAFYDQENCNLSLYKSSRISLTNAILYCQSPVYLQQLKYKVTASRGRILNPSFNLPVNNSSSRSKRRLRVALMFTYAFLVIIEVESSFQENKTSTEIYKNLLSCRRYFRLFVCFPLFILCLHFERAQAEINRQKSKVCRAPPKNLGNFLLRLGWNGV